MEDKLFDYDSYDYAGADYIFYDCTFKQDVGPYEEGDEVPLVQLSYENAWIEVFEEVKEAPDWKGRLSLKIEEAAEEEGEEA